MDRLSVFTLNSWLVPYIQSRNVKKRASGIVSTVASLDPDIVLLQEVFNVPYRKYFSENLPAYYYPKDMFKERRLFWIIPFLDASGGLVTLSKYPIEDYSFHPFEARGPRVGERVCRKGYTKARVGWCEEHILVVNTHLYAGVEKNKVRKEQLAQLLADVKEAVYPVILGGDFNVSNSGGEKPEEFYMLEEAGFIDSLVGPEEQFNTYCSSNSYTGGDLGGLTQDSRLDYVFFRSNSNRIEPTESALIGVAEPLSDHYGYLAKLEIRGR